MSPTLGFYDVYSLTEPALLAHIPRPVHALITLIPAPIYHASRRTDATLSTRPYTAAGAAEPVFWVKQTIGHSCGLMALLHSLANGRARDYVAADSPLDALLRAAVDLAPVPRAKLVYDSELLEGAHKAAAQTGDSRAPAPEEDNDLHFIAYVKGRDGRLWELEGGWVGPIERGVLAEGEDVLAERAVEMGVGRFLETMRAQGEGADGRFSIVAVAGRETS